MPTIAWILIWVAVIGTVALFAMREIRSGRMGPVEVDRLKHQAVRDASVRNDINGPNGPRSTLLQ